MTRALAAWAALLVTAAGCGGPPPDPPELTVDETRALVTASEPLTEVVVRDEAGLVLGRQAGYGDSTDVSVLHGAAPGTPLVVDATLADGTVTLRGRVPRERGPVAIDVAVPAGQGSVPLADEHAFTVVEGSTVQAALTLLVATPGTLIIRAGDEAASAEVTTTVPDERRVVIVDVPSDRATRLTIGGAAGTWSTALRPAVVTREAARAELAMAPPTFPATADGRPEATRPSGRVTLPAGWWRALLRATGLGYRARDPHAPWSFQAVTLTNDGVHPLNVAVRARVLDTDGAPADAFRPKMRIEAGNVSGEVSALLRVPAGSSATATLPFFVEGRDLPEGASLWTHELTVTPLGSSEPLWTSTERLQVRRGSSWISLGLSVALAGAFAGVLLLALRLRRWLDALRTADLVTIAVFATLSFLIAGASTVYSAAVAAVLGPFALFVTALLDDVLRYALLATLVTLLPRPGVAALTVLLTWLMRGIALGSFSPIDVVSVGAQVFWLEAALYVAGITRGGGAWADGSWTSRWLRLGGAFSAASILTSLTGLVVAMVMYRLYYAGWYVGAVLGGPGFLYVWLSCGLGAGFAASLREVSD